MAEKKEQAKETKKDRYVAYVSCYTTASREKYGIRVYDVDMEEGRFIEKDQVRSQTPPMSPSPTTGSTSTPSRTWALSPMSSGRTEI